MIISDYLKHNGKSSMKRKCYHSKDKQALGLLDRDLYSLMLIHNCKIEISISASVNILKHISVIVSPICKNTSRPFDFLKISIYEIYSGKHTKNLLKHLFFPNFSLKRQNIKIYILHYFHLYRGHVFLFL